MKGGCLELEGDVFGHSHSVVFGSHTIDTLAAD